MTGHDADEAVLEPRRSSAVATPVRISQARVDLQRVGGDRHRVLAARAQPVGQRERHRRLADAGRPEDRDQPCLE